MPSGSSSILSPTYTGNGSPRTGLLSPCSSSPSVVLPSSHGKTTRWSRVCPDDPGSRTRNVEFFKRHGFEVDGDRTQRYGLLPNDALNPLMPFAILQYSYGRAGAVVSSPVNDQGHRKHFDLRRTYGLNGAQSE